MTTQMFTSDRLVSSSTSQSGLRSNQAMMNVRDEFNQSLQLLEKARNLYQAPQQEKFQHLQADADSLLQQLQSLKQQRSGSVDETANIEDCCDTESEAR
jgi:hypothetical protein